MSASPVSSASPVGSASRRPSGTAGRRRNPELPSRAGAATRVLLLIDDPHTTVADLAGAIGADPAFTARVIALANSAYYGLSGRVGTLHYAISVLGFQTVRALAVSLAAGLDGPNGAPDGFWEQAALAATAASVIAPLLGGSAPDAFCVGLLHTLGSALLHQRETLPQLCLPFPASVDELNQREVELYGRAHAEEGAAMLASWRFPDRLCALVATHHEVPLPDAPPLTRALGAARVLTDLSLREDPDTAHAEHALRRLSEGKLTATDIAPLLGQVQDRARALLDGLRPR
jgi:HD-like signal output (HDOD) protein